MAKWFSFETKNETVKNALRQFLKDNNIYYELSSCFDGVHFEIKCNDAQAETINSFLDSIY